MIKHAGKLRSKAALDIGSHFIKMVEISGSPERPSLVSFGMRKIQGASGEALSADVKSLSEELKLTVKDLNVSLSGPSVVARVISMPEMADEELKSAIRFEVEKFIPFDINECVLDYYVQGKDAKDKNNIDILLAAAKRDSVLARVKIVEDAGFSINVIDADSFAITNAFLRNYPSTEQAKTMALLNIGSAYTSLIIVRGGLISFVRDLSMGAGNFRESVLKKCGIDLDLADAMKGVAADKTAEVIACSRAALAGLLDEIKLSFGYYENQSGRGIDGIYLSGSGAGFVGLEEAFGDAFGSKPERWNPFQFLYMDPAAINVDEIARSHGSFAVAVGLALR